MPFLVNTRRRRVKKKKACSTFSITYLNPIKLRSLIFAQFLHWQNLYFRLCLSDDWKCPARDYMKYAKIRAFSDSYFPICGQTYIRIFPYLDRIFDSAQTRENTDTILSIYGKTPVLSLCEICPNMGFLWSEISGIWTESCQYFPDFGQNWRFCLNKGKYGYDSAHIRENMDQRKPYLGIFHAVREQELDAN